ncbi:MAG TPA: hypothetical protein VK654_05250 [Nitrospirota bacterium]|nr:hypothetical protein [Nitrospirota bacterium]
MTALHRTPLNKRCAEPRRALRLRLLSALALVLIILCGAAFADDERDALMERQRTLKARVAALQREQDYLMFLQRMYESDSKYLVLDMKKKTAHLRYKNRLLKDIPLKEISPGFGRKVKAGEHAVTMKIEGAKERHALVLNNAFVLKWKRSEVPRPHASLPSIVVLKKDLFSFYYTIGPGMMAYVLE